jgi:proteasome assembly chaperone (PAC2) family protein
MVAVEAAALVVQEDQEDQEEELVAVEVIPQSVVEVPSVILLHKNFLLTIKHPQDQSDLILTPRN